MTLLNLKSDLTPVLMLVPYFAPQTHAAMFRAHKLAKYLPTMGYRPVVVTTDTNYLYNEDESLLKELPAVVEVYRARYIEPTLRGLGLGVGGRARTFAALKRQGAIAMPASQLSGAKQDVAKPRGALSASLVRLIGEWPDRHWTWSLAAHSLCRRLIREQNIRLIYTSAVPTSPLGVAARLKSEFDLRWLADFRDPVGYGAKHSAQGILSSEIERQLVACTMRSADMVTGLAASYGSIFHDLHGLHESRYRFIPTGLDESYLQGSEPPKQPTDTLLHVGEVMPNQSPYVFEVLSRAVQAGHAKVQNLKLVFVGRREVNEPLVRALLGGIPDWQIPVEFVDHVPQSSVYAMARSARACLLVPGQSRFWWTNFAKLVDYMALGVPVIADVPRVSEARDELNKTGQAFFLRDVSQEEDATQLMTWLNSTRHGPSNDYGQRYVATAQAAAFAKVLDELLMTSA